MEKEKRDWEALASELRGLLQGLATSEGITVYAGTNNAAIFVEPLAGHEGTSLLGYSLYGITDFCRCKGLHAVVRAHTDYNNNALWRVTIF
jgi:hypothetical protein